MAAGADVEAGQLAEAQPDETPRCRYAGYSTGMQGMQDCTGGGLRGTPSVIGWGLGRGLGLGRSWQCVMRREYGSMHGDAGSVEGGSHGMHGGAVVVAPPSRHRAT